MSRKRIRVTGFTRFVLFMIVVAPLAYIGAAYYHGDNGIQKFKELIGMDNTTEVVTNNSSTRNLQPSNCETLERENTQLKQQILDLKERLNSIENNN